jgi:hypothetical protein
MNTIGQKLTAARDAIEPKLPAFADGAICWRGPCQLKHLILIGSNSDTCLADICDAEGRKVGTAEVRFGGDGTVASAAVRPIV